MAKTFAETIAALPGKGLSFVAQPYLSGTPWDDSWRKRKPEEIDRSKLDFFVYKTGDISEGEGAFASVKEFRTPGRMMQGRDSNGSAVACVKIDVNKVPKSLDVSPYVRRPDTAGFLLHSVSSLPPQRYHVVTKDRKHLLIVYSQKKDETSVLNKLEETGLFNRMTSRASPMKYQEEGGLFVALEVPEWLMKSMQRTDGNSIQPLSVLPELSNSQRDRMNAGTMSQELIIKLARQHLKPEEKQKGVAQADTASYTLEDVLPRLRSANLGFSVLRGEDGATHIELDRVSQETHQLLSEAADGIAMPPYQTNKISYEISARDSQRLKALLDMTLSEHLDMLRAERITFSARRRLDGGTQYLLTGVGDKTHKILTEAKDGVALAHAAERGAYALSTEDAQKLKDVIGQDNITESSATVPAALPNAFFTKYSTLFESVHGEHYLYIAPKSQTNTTSSAMLLEMNSHGLGGVSEAITQAQEMPPVVRVQLTPQVAEDLSAQAKSQKKTPPATRLPFGQHASFIMGGDKTNSAPEKVAYLTVESLDAAARKAFHVKTKRQEIKAVHTVAVGSRSITPQREVEAEQPLDPVQARARALEMLADTDTEKLLFVPVRDGEQTDHYLLWRTSLTKLSPTPAEAKKEPVNIKSAREFVIQAKAAWPETKKLDDRMEQAPLHLWAMKLDEAAYAELKEAKPEISELKPVSDKKALTEKSVEHFNQLDKQKEHYEANPFAAAIEHISGRNTLAVNVVHPSAHQVRKGIEKLNAAALHSVLADIEHARRSGGDALDILEELNGLCAAGAPAVSSRTDATLSHMRNAATSDARAKEEYHNVRLQLEEYEQWLTHYQLPVPGYVTQLMIMNPNATTDMLLADKDVKKHMTRPPQKIQVPGVGSAMLLYPDEKMMHDVLIEKTHLPFFGKTDEGIAVEALAGVIKSRFAQVEPETAAPQLHADSIYANEPCAHIVSAMTMLEAPPILLREEPTPPSDPNIGVEESIGARHVLLLKVPQRKQGEKALLSVLNNAAPYLQGRKYFGAIKEEENVELPLLSEKEAEYLAIKNELKRLMEERKELGNDREASGLRVRDLREKLWNMDELHPEIGDAVDAYLKALEAKNEGVAHYEDEQEVQRVVSVAQNKQRIYGLNGTGYDTLEDFMNDPQHGEYIKVYVSDELAQYCSREALKNNAPLSVHGGGRPVREDKLAEATIMMATASVQR